MNRAHLTVAAVVLLSVACASTRADVIDDFVSTGLDVESAECVMASFERQGFETADAAGFVSSDAEEAIEVGIEECVRSGSIDASEMAELSDEDELRKTFIETFLDLDFTEADARCVLDAIEADGYTMIDVSMEGMSDQDGPALRAVGAATVDCTSS